MDDKKDSEKKSEEEDRAKVIKKDLRVGMDDKKDSDKKIKEEDRAKAGVVAKIDLRVGMDDKKDSEKKSEEENRANVPKIDLRVGMDDKKDSEKKSEEENRANVAKIDLRVSMDDKKDSEKKSEEENRANDGEKDKRVGMDDKKDSEKKREEENIGQDIGVVSMSLRPRTKRLKKIIPCRSRKRLKTEGQDIRKLSEAEDIFNLINSGQKYKAAELFLKKRFDSEVITELLENFIYSRSDIHCLLDNCAKILMTKMQGKVKSAWVGFRERYPNTPVFVLIYYDNGVRLSKNDIPYAFRSFEFVFRHEFEVSDEAREITKKTRIYISQDMKGVRNSLPRKTYQLLKCHSNVEMIGFSNVRSTQYGHKRYRLTNDYCIVMYVHVKGIIPFNEKEFPRSIDDTPVDVREGKFVPYNNVPGAMEYHKNLLMGCRIVRYNGSSGTLGGFVDLHDGNVGILTCAHVALTEDETNTYLRSSREDQLRQQKSIPWNTPRMCQPDQYNEFGTVRNFVLDPGDPSTVGIDAAVITITDPARKPVSGAFPKDNNSSLGFTEDRQMEFYTGHCCKIEERKEGCEVIKFGATSGITRGLIAHCCLYTRKSDIKALYGNSSMYNQMEIAPLHGFQGFAQSGDSGAIVFLANNGNRSSLVAVGMVVGGTTSNTTVVTPIFDIFKALGLKNICFKKFYPCPRPNKLLSIEDLNTEQVKLSKQIIGQKKYFQRQINQMRKDFNQMRKDNNQMRKDFKKDITKTQNMIQKVYKHIKQKR